MLSVPMPAPRAITFKVGSVCEESCQLPSLADRIASRHSRDQRRRLIFVLRSRLEIDVNATGLKDLNCGVESCRNKALWGP